MTQRKHTPLHDFWHPRVEGQIRHTIGCHPGWFRLKDERQRKNLINSLAKRIVGEIVAGIRLAPMPDSMVANCAVPEARGDERNLSSPGESVPLTCAPAGKPKP